MLSTAFLLAASMVVGQDQSAVEHLQPFKPFLGMWTLQGGLQEDVSLPSGGVLEKGTKLVASNSFRWAINRNAVVFDWSLKFEGQDFIYSTQLMVWEKKDKVIRCIWQHTAGEQGTTDWSFEGDALVGKVQAVDNEGVESSSKVYFRLKGKDAYTWKSTDRIRGGKPLPDTSEYEYVRVR